MAKYLSLDRLNQVTKADQHIPGIFREAGNQYAGKHALGEAIRGMHTYLSHSSDQLSPEFATGLKEYLAKRLPDNATHLKLDALIDSKTLQPNVRVSATQRWYQTAKNAVEKVENAIKSSYQTLSRELPQAVATVKESYISIIQQTLNVADTVFASLPSANVALKSIGALTLASLASCHTSYQHAKQERLNYEKKMQIEAPGQDPSLDLDWKVLMLNELARAPKRVDNNTTELHARLEPIAPPRPSVPILDIASLVPSMPVEAVLASNLADPVAPSLIFAQESKASVPEISLKTLVESAALHVDYRAETSQDAVQKTLESAKEWRDTPFERLTATQRRALYDSIMEYEVLAKEGKNPRTPPLLAARKNFSMERVLIASEFQKGEPSMKILSDGSLEMRLDAESIGPWTISTYDSKWNTPESVSNLISEALRERENIQEPLISKVEVSYLEPIAPPRPGAPLPPPTERVEISNRPNKDPMYTGITWEIGSGISVSQVEEARKTSAEWSTLPWSQLTSVQQFALALDFEAEDQAAKRNIPYTISELSMNRSVMDVVRSHDTFGVEVSSRGMTDATGNATHVPIWRFNAETKQMEPQDSLE